MFFYMVLIDTQEIVSLMVDILHIRFIPKIGRSEMERIGFLYDTTRCVGCKACQIACKEQNKLGVGEFFRRVETLTEEGVLTHFSAA